MPKKAQIHHIGSQTEPSITPKQQRTVAFLATRAREKDALELAGVSRETYRRWRRNPAFVAALKQAREDAFREALDTLKCSVSKAVITLMNLMDSSSEPVRCRAADCLLAHTFRAAETLDILARIEALEARINDRR